MAAMHEPIIYSEQEVADVLFRMSNIVVGKPIAFPEGSLQWSAEDIQSHWRVVAWAAGAAGNGALEGPPLDSTKVIFNYLETVIISCGAPDSFDIYEVCFESLTKMGFYLQSPAAKGSLFQLLENVHEVYDVLLSCVETYEWVQPGATGHLRLWMLQVLFACFGATTITGRHLMELTDNDVPGAVSLISFILRCEQAPFLMQDTAGRCLVELTTADSVFLQTNQEGSENFQNEQIAKLTAMLNRHVNGLIKGIIQFDLVEGFGRCICQHQMNHARTDVIVKHFLTTIHNCLLYCSENQKKLRQHLATQSTIVQDIMIPYVHNILPALYDHPNCGPHMIEWQNLKATLQTFVVVSFSINVFRPQLRDTDMLVLVCRVPHILEHISMLELLIKICINVEFNKGEHGEELRQTLENAYNNLPGNPESALRLRRRLTSEQSMRLPYAKCNVQAATALAFALQPPPGEEVVDAAAVEVRKARRKNQWRNAKNKNKKRKRLFSMQASGQKAQGGAAAAEEDEEEDSEEEDVAPFMPAEGWESTLGRTDEAGVPSKAVCQLSGTFMHDPVATPEGHVFERVALEDWMATSGEVNPMTGMPLSMEQCAPATEIANYIQGYQMQMLSACQIAPAAFDEPPMIEAEVPAQPAAEPAAPPPAPVATGPSLLGDLPALEKEHTERKEKKKEKGKITIPSRSVIDCPEEMRCKIDGKVCVNPVRSPYGHLFEKNTLAKWIQNCGSVCPITGKPLRMEECAPDADMKKRIIRFLKRQE
mmetsp:Transcript_82957/g.231423  ORF Transcript_82957/g.231423 Transcript_82957/m.231423 type:complete len:764 (+) Transcript_82957:106-2397(+)